MQSFLREQVPFSEGSNRTSIAGRKGCSYWGHGAMNSVLYVRLRISQSRSFGVRGLNSVRFYNCKLRGTGEKELKVDNAVSLC